MNSSMYPTSFTADQASVDKLQSLYKSAYTKITNEMEGATSFGVANRKALLSQIDGILAELQNTAEGVIDKQITDAYKTGGDDAVRQLMHIGADVSSGQSFNSIHQDAVRALVDDTARSFADSISGVRRDTQNLLSDAVKQQITDKLATGKISGDTLDKIKKDLVNTMRQDGLTALRDKSGKRWDLNTYSEMLIRTKSNEARNTALANRMLENGYDLAQVSAHGAIDQCAKWEGKIISMNGTTPGYPTLDDTELGGLFHPNCRHTINALIPDLASQTDAYNGLVDTQTGKEFIDQVDVNLKGMVAPVSQTQRPRNGDFYPHQAAAIDLIAKANIAAQTLNQVVTIGQGAKMMTFNLTEQEAQLATDYPIDYSVNNRMNAYGRYSSKYNDINFNQMQMNYNSIMRDNLTPESTFFHEFGHFIDYRAVNPNSQLSATPEFRKLIQDEGKSVVMQRLKRQYKGKYTEEEQVQLMQGKVIIKNGRRTGFSAKARAYYQKPVEIFGDAYGQYKTNPVEFEKYAPGMYNYFEEVLKTK